MILRRATDTYRRTVGMVVSWRCGGDALTTSWRWYRAFCRGSKTIISRSRFSLTIILRQVCKYASKRLHDSCPHSQRSQKNPEAESWTLHIFKWAPGYRRTVVRIYWDHFPTANQNHIVNHSREYLANILQLILERFATFLEQFLLKNKAWDTSSSYLKIISWLSQNRHKTFAEKSPCLSTPI